MKNKSLLRFKTIIFSLTLILSFSYVNAQEKGIYEVKSSVLLNTSKHSRSKLKKSDRSDFYNLAFKLHSTLYIKNNIIRKEYGIGDIEKITLEDTKSFSLLRNSNPKYSSVKLITIKIKSLTDLNGLHDLSKIQGFSNLLYIYVKSYIKLDNDDINKFIKVNPNVRVFYMYDIPS